MFLGDLIKKYRTINKLSLRDFASRCGLSHTYISALEKNIDPRTGKPIAPTLDTVKYVAKGMNTTIEEILKVLDEQQEFVINQDLPSIHKNNSTSSLSDELKKIGAIPLSDIDTVKIPILGTIKAGYDYLAQENIIDYIAFKVNGTDKENYYALNIVGDSMEPLFDNGDTVIVHKQDDFENGDNCVVLINGEEATVKKVYKGNTGLELKAVNPYYPPRIFTKEEIKDLPVKVIGVVEKSIRNFKKK